MSQPNNALQAKKLNSVRELIQQCNKQIAAALPKHMTAERMMRIAFSATQRQPKLLECTPQSLALSIINAAELGIEPNLIGEAYLVPYKTTCTLIPGYKGLMKLARNSGMVTSFQVGVVREGDTFEYERGSNKFLRHVEKLDNDDAPITHYWAGATVQGEFEFEVMTAGQVDKIRSKSPGGRSGPWVDHTEEMGKKTVIRRLCKLLPASAELSKAVTLDERAEAGLPQTSDIVDLGEAEVHDNPKSTAPGRVKEKLGIKDPEPAQKAPEQALVAIPAEGSEEFLAQSEGWSKQRIQTYEDVRADKMSEGMTAEHAHEAAWEAALQVS